MLMALQSLIDVLMVGIAKSDRWLTHRRLIDILLKERHDCQSWGTPHFSSTSTAYFGSQSGILIRVKNLVESCNLFIVLLRISCKVVLEELIAWRADCETENWQHCRIFYGPQNETKGDRSKKSEKNFVVICEREAFLWIIYFQFVIRLFPVFSPIYYFIPKSSQFDYVFH